MHFSSFGGKARDIQNSLSLWYIFTLISTLLNDNFSACAVDSCYEATSEVKYHKNYRICCIEMNSEDGIATFIFNTDVQRLITDSTSTHLVYVINLRDSKSSNEGCKNNDEKGKDIIFLSKY